MGRAERTAQRVQVALAKAEADRARRQWLGLRAIGACNRIRALRIKAERTLAVWIERDAAWQRAEAAVPLFTPEGELNTRVRAEAELAEVLPQLPEAEFAAVKGLLGRPQVLTYLDEVQRKLQTLPVPAEIREAAVQQEGLRRRPELLRGDSPAAAARRALLLVCAVVLAKAEGVGTLAVEGMQQARHRKMSQGLLDLKRLYWNSQPFRTGSSEEAFAVPTAGGAMAGGSALVGSPPVDAGTPAPGTVHPQRGRMRKCREWFGYNCLPARFLSLDL